ncbi:MAG: hypothetical protein VKL39_01825 [Leptolyngbyaceae bacterium]|nr:hypothetical protein [Leptolyngbyaceae bacterium]
MNHTVSDAFRSVVPAIVASVALLDVLILPANAAEIDNVSPTIFQCVKDNSSGERGYLSFPSENSGTIDAYAQVLDIWGGSVDFNYDSTSQILTLTNPQGPGGEQIVEGLRDVTRQCINGEVE